ncbi:MAG: hypothetical protein JST00_36250 [Deltaproteobacteria bacterium]|nr:hypothetical protein [Deltaproteobacteria bacterium]
MYSTYPPPPSRFPGHSLPPPPPRTASPVLYVLVAMGLMAVLGGVLGTCGVVGGLVALGAASNDPGGVVLGTQVPPSIVASLREKRLLRDGENVLAYYDASIAGDMSELTFVTSERVVYAKGATIASLLLKDVARVSHRKEPLIGDIVEIATSDAQSMRVEIAPLNHGESYLDALEDAWRRHQPAARIARAAR